MTQRQMSIRIGLDGKADIQRDMNDIATSGDAAFGQLGKAIDDGTSALMRQKDAYDRIAEAQANVQTQRANQGAFNQVLGVNPLGGAGNAQASAAAFQTAMTGMEQRAAALRAQLDPLGAAQTHMNAAVADADVLLGKNLITQTEHTAAVALARKAYTDAALAMGALSAGEEFNATKTRELAEVFVHLAQGASAGGLSLRQLGMSVGDLMRASSGGGIGGIFSALGSTASNPYVLAGAAIVAVTGSVIVAFNRAEEAEKQLASATQLAARATGATREELDGYAHTAADAADISVSSARDIQAAFAQTGAVGGKQLTALTEVTAQFARATGEDMDTARDALVKAFADPSKSGEQLLGQLGGLDDKTKQYIDTMIAENETTKAQTALLDALKKSIAGAEDQTGLWAGIWNTVKTAASDAIEAMSHGFSPAPLNAQLANAKTQLQGLVAANDGGFFDVQIAGWTKRVAELQAQVDTANKGAQKAAADAAAIQLSNAAGPLIRNAVPDFGTLADLKNQQAVFAQLASNQAAQSHLSAEAKRDEAAAQDAVNRAISTYIDPATRAAHASQIDTDSITAFLPAQKAAIAQDRERLALAGQKISTAEADARIQQAGALAYATAQHAIDKHTMALGANLRAQLAVADAYLKGNAAGIVAEEGVKKLDDVVGKAALGGAKQAAQLDDETAARKNLNDQVAAGIITSEQASREMATQTALAPLIIASHLAEGAAKAELTKIITALTAAREGDNAEQIRTRALADVESSERNLAFLRQQLALSNDNDAARQVEIAVLGEKQQLLTQNIDAESAEGKALLANAAAAAALNQQLDLAKASRQEVESMFDTLGGQFSDFVTQGKFGWQDWSQFAISALQDVESEMIKLAVLNPLKNMLFGTSEPTTSGVAGILGSILGAGDTSGVIGGMPFGVLHGGGMADAANANRMLPANVLRFAPRFHTGAMLGPDEIPAVLQTGERVLNRQETRDWNGGRANGTTGKIEITVKVDGARGSAEIEDAANRGAQRAIAASAQMLRGYDGKLESRVFPIVHKAVNDPRLRR